MNRENSHPDLKLLAEAIKSVSHPERLAIVQLLCRHRGERLTVKNIYKNLHIEQSVASKHLGIMRRSGLLKREAEGIHTYYTFNTENPVTECITGLFLES